MTFQSSSGPRSAAGCIILLTCAVFSAWADGGFPRVAVPGIDPQRELAKTAKPDRPLQFAVGREVVIAPSSHGRWTTDPDGSRTWRLEVAMPGATDINLGFRRFYLPPGGELRLSAAFKSRSTRHVFAADHHRNGGRLWTPILPGPVARMEMEIPADAAFEPQLVLSRVSGGFRDAWQLSGGPGLKSHGECNNDVACPAGDPWRDQIAAVALYSVDGRFVCSGTLIADVPQSRRSFFLSAYHCNVTPSVADSVVTYWNFESPRCGDQGGGTLDQFTVGATWRAGRRDVDMLLLELHQPPDKLYGAFHSGWDRSEIPPAGSVAIHHPQADVKSISFNDDPLIISASCILRDSKVLTHWEVDNWEDGTTELGSSGSGLWDVDSGKLIGFLSGGEASCSNPGGYDCYGQFAAAWEGPTPQSRLRDWLDPEANDPKATPGIHPDLMFSTGFE